MAERGVSLALSTILCWVQHYAPEFEKRWNRFARMAGSSWRVDDTYTKVRGRWVCLYRAVDARGKTVDFRLSRKRDVAAAKAFFRNAYKTQGRVPRTITLDGYQPLPSGRSRAWGRGSKADPLSPNVWLGGLGHYVGTQWLFPYSITAKLPVTNTPTLILFINYSRIEVLYRDSPVPEVYNGVVFGLVKVINKNVTLSYTNENLMGCKCVARVPGPDNLRWAGGILKIDFHTGL